MARNRKEPTYKLIDPTEYELSTVKDGLKEYYSNNPGFLKDGESIEQKISEVISTCSNGWAYCPKTFLKRVETLTKWRTRALKTRFDYSPSYYNAKQLQTQEDIEKSNTGLYPGVSASDLRKLLSPDERKFWQERESYYRTEFEFNNSSDWSLLLQVLLEELTQRRLVQKRMKDPNVQIDEEIDASHKRLITTQKALGITREQRESATNETDGNIAQLGVKYDNKMKILAKKEAMDRLEEETNMANRRPQYLISQIPSDMAETILAAEAQEERDLLIDLKGIDEKDIKIDD